MGKFEVCIVEKKFPDLVELGKAAQGRENSFVSVDAFSAYQAMRKELGPANLHRHAYLLYGASLERCVSSLAEQLIRDHGATKVVIDLLRSYSLAEDSSNALSPKERMEQLLAFRPAVAEFIKSGALAIRE
jgi:hypothetical protein